MKKRCQVKSSCLVGLQTGRHTFKRLIFLTLSLIFLSWSSASFACSVHDHGCIFHSFNSTVQVNPPIVQTNNNALVIYAIGTNGIGGTPSAIDFDNKVLLPANTGDKFLVGSPTNYNIPTGPYIVSSTSYGAANPPPVWSPAGGAGALQVYPSQYQVIFNQNTAVAKHTGDLNGGENGNIPNATGCPNKPGAANCEAVVVTGNVPNGLYEQKVRIFNFQNTPNPQVDIQYGAYVTGQLAMVNASHETNATASFAHLSGNGDITPTAVYEVYNRGFNPYASGTAWFDRSKNRISGYSNPYQQGTHVYQDKFITNTLTRTTVQGNGDSSQHSTNTYSVVKMDLGAYVPPAPVLDPHPMFTAFMQSSSQLGVPFTQLGSMPSFAGINAPYTMEVMESEVAKNRSAKDFGISTKCANFDMQCNQSLGIIVSAMNKYNGNVADARTEVDIARWQIGREVTTENGKNLRNAEHYLAARDQGYNPAFVVGYSYYARFFGNSNKEMQLYEVKFGLDGYTDFLLFK